MSFWNLFSGKDPRELFLDYTPQGSHWRVVTWNFDVKVSETRRWTVEVHSETSKIIHWEQGKTSELTFFQDKKCIRKKTVSSDSELKALMNLAIHLNLKFSLESNHEFMVTPVTGATTQDVQNETLALQWIQATFGTLIRALDSFKHKPDLILVGACFAGRTPDSEEEVIRVIAFNLDIFYYLRPDNTLHIAIFDDKNLGHGESKVPTFQQIIKVTKPQFYDEITKLLHRLAQVGEIN